LEVLALHVHIELAIVEEMQDAELAHRMAFESCLAERVAHICAAANHVFVQRVLGKSIVSECDAMQCAMLMPSRTLEYRICCEMNTLRPCKQMLLVWRALSKVKGAGQSQPKVARHAPHVLLVLRPQVVLQRAQRRELWRRRCPGGGGGGYAEDA